MDVSGERGGTILVEAEALTLTKGAMFLNQTAGGLSGGDIVIRAQALTLRGGSRMFALTAPESAGDAGSVRVEAQTVTIREGSFIASVTYGAGRSGNVTVTADTLMMDGSLEFPSQISTASALGATGDAGSVRVEAQTVTLTNGALIQSGAFGAGRGGNVTVMARDAVTVDGFGIVLTDQGQEPVPSLIAASNQPGATGDAGSVRVEAQTVSLTNGAQIQSVTWGPGRGGNVTVMARDAVTVDGFGGGALSLIATSSLPGHR